MARLPRLSVPGGLHHVIQRGHNGQQIFRQPMDYQFMWQLLLQFSRESEVAVHSYVLMPDHFHLLLTPRTEAGLPTMLQAVGRRYVRYFNDAQSRTGTLWDGRYRCTILQPERYLLACMTYIDQNPLRAGLETQASNYPWSSAAHYTGRRADALVVPHALYWELGNTPFAREAAYAEALQTPVSPALSAELTEYSLKGWVLGEPEFIAALQKETSRRLSKSRPGRPPRSQTA